MTTAAQAARKAKKRSKLKTAIRARQAPAVQSEETQLIALCETDLKTFVEEAWATVVPSEPFQDNWHIDAICDHLEALTRREFWNLLINIPPRFGKSLLVSVMWPAWLWLQDPTLRHVSSSYAQSLSTRDSVATRRLIESPWYQSRWADRFALTGDQNEKTKFENTVRGFRLATSVGGVATGEGGDVITVDDPHNVNEVESDTVRKGVLDWWNVTMPTRSGRGGRSMRVVVMQRVHEDDLSADIIKKNSYEHLCLPLEYEKNPPKGYRGRTWSGWTDPRTEDGALLWPQRMSKEIIDTTLKPPHMSSYAYAGQFQQRPAPLEGGMFQRKWWKFYKSGQLGVVDSLIAKAQDKCWSWDMAFKDLESSDFVCGLAWVRIAADFYLLPHRVHDRLGFSASRTAVKTCAGKYPKIHYKIVEDKANGSAVIDDLKHNVGGLTPIEPEGGKEARASVMQPYCESGNVYLPEDASWVEEYMEEFRVFPNGTNDDYVDASSQALVWMLNRMARGFAPMSASWTTNTQTREAGETYRDPREGERSVLVKPTDRGDAKRADVVERAIEYVRNANGHASRQSFVTDHEPVGERLLRDVKRTGLVVEEPDGALRLAAAKR